MIASKVMVVVPISLYKDTMCGGRGEGVFIVKRGGEMQIYSFSYPLILSNCSRCITTLRIHLITKVDHEFYIKKELRTKICFKERHFCFNIVLMRKRKLQCNRMSSTQVQITVYSHLLQTISIRWMFFLNFVSIGCFYHYVTAELGWYSALCPSWIFPIEATELSRR